MTLIFTQQGTLLLLLAATAMATFFSFAHSYTVIMSDSNPPSALVDAPQTGFSMRNSGGHTDPEEQKAVYEIMRATGNDWAAAIPDVCKGRWHGIECMPDGDQTYHVVSLSFGALSDDTAFPTCDPARSFLSPALTKLPHIRSLFFYRCFTGNPQPVPPFLGQLGASLHSLVLRENAHLGSIPAQLGNLTRLRILDLHSNNLTSSIPKTFSSLTALRSLDLSGNRLTGCILDSLSGLKALNVLDLSDNLLSGSIPDSLGGGGRGEAPLLIKVDLSRNRLVGRIPDSLSGLTSLTLLDLSNNRLTGPLPVSLGRLTSLQTLLLNKNSLQCEIPGGGVFSKNLTVLILSNAGLRGQIPETMGELSRLRVLRLDGNRLSGSIPRRFRKLKSLTELRLSDNRLVGPIPFEPEVVWRMGRKLRVSNNSGLCCEPDGVRGDASFLLGIQYCNSESGGVPAGRTATQHLSASLDAAKSMGVTADDSGSATSLHPHHLIHFFLFLCCGFGLWLS